MKKESLSAAELAEKASDVFEGNPNFDEVHQTTDGQCFDRKDNAVNHQISLTKDGDHVKLVRRSDITKKEGGKGSKKETGADGGAGTGTGSGSSQDGGNKELKFAELQELCRANELPEEEWSSFKSKADVTAYLVSKGVEIK